MSTTNASCTLTKPTDQELSDLVAIRLCGWKRNDDGKWVQPGFLGAMSFRPNFAQNESSAVGLLDDAEVQAAITRVDGRWSVEILPDIRGEATSLARAICIALLRADGVSIYGA